MNEKAITLNTLLKGLADQGDAALVFRAGDESIRPRYHVTEIKCAEVRSIDCGRGAEQWEESPFSCWTARLRQAVNT